MSSVAKRLLSANILELRHERISEFQQGLSQALRGQLSSTFAFPKYVEGAAALKSLLRIPILARTSGARDAAIAALRRAGVAASSLYRTAIPGIAGVEGFGFADDAAFNASGFASRLFTVPTLQGQPQARCDGILAALMRVHTAFGSSR
jgi:hypothetical protein